MRKVFGERDMLWERAVLKSIMQEVELDVDMTMGKTEQIEWNTGRALDKEEA